MKRSPASAVYERCVAAFCAESELASEAVSMTANAKIKGVISGRTRQIDVLVDDMRYSARASRIIVDAKRRSRRMDIKNVEEFEGMMRDCGARHGVIVCTSGATKGAIRRAQDFITITVLPYEDALEFEWEYEPCLGCHCAGLTARSGMVLWNHRITGLGPGWLMYNTGKCDRCHQFHAWCSDCGSHLCVADGQTMRCGCVDREWGSIPESRASGHTGTPESTWLMLKHRGEFLALDRKPIGKVRHQIGTAGINDHA
jgi:methyl coenzyme M reductase beta subunit